MNYVEALKQVRTTKPATGFLIIALNYDKFIVPYADGIRILEAFSAAEQFDDGYNSNRIEPLDSGRITVTTLSKDQYDLYKIAALMGVTFNDAKEARNAANKPDAGAIPIEPA